MAQYAVMIYERETPNGVADIPFPRAIHDELIASGRAKPHQAGFPSIVSFYISRQAIGTFKCCSDTYTPGTRNYTFDTDFLLPSLLPPATPMFRDVNTLTFRQLLRPTQ